MGYRVSVWGMGVYGGKERGCDFPTHLLKSLGPITLLALVGDGVMESLESVLLLSDLLIK